jgi:hypothetical protein
MRRKPSGSAWRNTKRRELKAARDFLNFHPQDKLEKEWTRRKHPNGLLTLWLVTKTKLPRPLLTRRRTRRNPRRISSQCLTFLRSESPELPRETDQREEREETEGIEEIELLEEEEEEREEEEDVVEHLLEEETHQPL